MIAFLWIMQHYLHATFPLWLWAVAWVSLIAETIPPWLKFSRILFDFLIRHRIPEEFS